MPQASFAPPGGAAIPLAGVGASLRRRLERQLDVGQQVLHRRGQAPDRMPAGRRTQITPRHVQVHLRAGQLAVRIGGSESGSTRDI